MKRLTIIAVLLVAALVGLPAEASAQFDLSRALGAFLGEPEDPNAEPQPTPYDLLRENAPQPSKLTGVWLYDAMALEMLAVNPLAEAALKQMEGYLQAELRGAGIGPGYFGLTLRRNGVAFLSHEDLVFEGRYIYKVEDASVRVEATIEGVSLSIGGYVKMMKGALVLLLDAKDIVAATLKLYPEYAADPTVATAQGMLRSIEGVYLGLKFRR
ncbi:MAG: DUF4923 family protein [Alistipes sp.]|nr:DUF4923 family protein [Alistipes sp.]